MIYDLLRMIMMFSLFTKKQLSIVDKAMLKKALFRACKICVSFVF